MSRGGSVGSIAIALVLATSAAAQTPPSPVPGAASPSSAVVPGTSPPPALLTTPSPGATNSSAAPVTQPPSPAAPPAALPSSVGAAPVPTSNVPPSPPAPVANVTSPRPLAASPGAPTASVAAANPTRVVEGSGQLPRTHGQIWRTYDLSPYVDSIQNATKPEQAVLDWVLRDTGTDVWFSQPFGLLSIEPKSLHVYHTPAMHETVKQVVERFNRSRGESYHVHVRLMTVGSPNWRSRAFGTLQPVPVQTPGVEAWLLTKENAALLVAELQRRLDVTEFDASTLSIVNGQTFATERRRPTTYVKTVAPAPGAPAGYATVQGSVDQGYQLQVSPLVSESDQVVDAVIRCRVDQVEKLVSVPLDVPSAAGKTQRIDVQVPQVSSSQLHERFRWPVDAVLLISGGMGAVPGAEAGKNVLGLPAGILESAPARADGLLFVEIQGRASQATPPTPRTAETWSVSGGRY